MTAPTDPPPSRQEMHRLLLRLLAQQQQTNAEIGRLAKSIQALDGTISDTPGVRQQRSLDAYKRARFEPPGHYLKD